MKDRKYDASLITCEGVEALLQFLPYFEDRCARFGEEASVTDGCVFPSILTTESIAFCEACYEHSFIQDFNWGEWSQSRRRMISSGEGIEGLDLAGIGRLLTSHLRGDHFCDGHLLGVMRSGQMARILKRLTMLKEDKDMAHKDIKIISIGERNFYFTPGPHLRADDSDWHEAYVMIIDRLLDETKANRCPVALPAYPLVSEDRCDDLLLEIASYWEGAMYFLCRVLHSPTPLDGLRTVEIAVNRDCLSFEQRLFMTIWNSHGQLKWLKAHLIREDKQHLLPHPISSAMELRNAAATHDDEEILWLSSFVEQHEVEGGKYPNPYFGGTNPLHLGLILHEDHDDSVNLFTDYKQQENRFTNGLVSVLKLAELHDRAFISSFFKDLLDIELHASPICAQVLEGYDKSSTADAVFIAADTRVFLETKIVSASLRQEQIHKHLHDLHEASEGTRCLALLTPDDSRSSYIGAYLDTDATHMKHLEWRSVYEYLSRYERNCTNSVLRSIIKQFLATIKSMIFEQDIAGIISKVSFGEKSGVYADQYLDDLRNGKWDRWNTPKLYKNLDGTGRKLLLYDKERKAITVEVEISKVEQTNEEADYPYSNWFADGSIRVLKPSIDAKTIESLAGFENFTRERAPYRNLTHEQYRELGLRAR
jgi:hypothetical protein